MKLDYSLSDFCRIIGADAPADQSVVQQVVYDTRKILNPEGAVFFALRGQRDGHEFIAEAYQKGIRLFVVQQDYGVEHLPEAHWLKVPDVLQALQQLAAQHRRRFMYPVVGITGSVGKTTVKEWIYHCLAAHFKIVRSPKSYNSQLGVALSLLEMDARHNLALIEAGISEPGEMQHLANMIQPDIGVFTAFGSAHAANFNDPAQHISEKLRLFASDKPLLMQENIGANVAQATVVRTSDYQDLLQYAPYQDEASLRNLSLVLALAQQLGLDPKVLIPEIKTLPRLALRMETFEGINGNTIINDTYNADLDALIQSLEYQRSLAQGRDCSAVIGIAGLEAAQVQKILDNVGQYGLKELILINEDQQPDIAHLKDQVVLIKGTRASHIERMVRQFKLKRHQTRVEINLSAVRHNLDYWRSLLHKDCQTLVMVKASSYGSGAEKMAAFLEKNGVSYLGVAYVDEGIELRRSGITLPILVMNVDEAGFDDLIRYELEPSLFSFSLLDGFTRTLIEQGREHYPIHLKFDTGMRRLGFEPEDAPRVLDFVAAQPELKVASIYSHLAESDKLDDSSFTHQQIQRFDGICELFQARLAYPFLRHLLNSEGVARFPEAQYDMVRIGIGLYGISVNPVNQKHLLAAISWHSQVSQLRRIEAGESVGYSRQFVASTDSTIAVIPVGYADGFRRSLSKGVGAVFIGGKRCAVTGNVCMDMIMVDVSGMEVQEGAPVEIIGAHQPIEALAEAMQTIPYEVLTSLSRRMERVYVEEQ